MPQLGYNSIICRYSEIAIKGRNRSKFENVLVENLYYLLQDLENIKISRVRGRIFVKHHDNTVFSESELSTIEVQLQKAFGVESFSPVIMIESDLQKILEVTKSCVPAVFQEPLQNSDQPVSFRIRARRADKTFRLTSKELEIELATLIDNELGNPSQLTIDLSDQAMISFYCEVREEFAFIYFKTYSAPGGLPPGSNGKILALLSGGIDSPVACYLLMKRGCSVNFITFHSDPYTPPETVDKVKRLTTILNQFQKPGKLFVCNLAPIQKMIRDQCQERFRTVLYRRMMFRIAQMVAEQNRYLALLTGEAVGQVASQTLINMGTIEKAIDMLVVRPLSGMDKLDVIRLAETIGTFPISNIQCPDSCTVFAPQSPSTSVPPQKAAQEEERLTDFPDVLKAITEAIETATG